jgi:hypothetical protein
MKQLRCPHCLKSVDSLKGFCPQCGKKMSEEDPLEKESTLQASADPALVAKALKERPFKKKEEEPTGTTDEVDIMDEEPAVPRSLDDEDSRILTEQLDAIAAYGQPPVKWWDAIPYAIRVFMRRRALKGDIKKIGDDCLRKKNERDADLLILGHLKMKDTALQKNYPDEVAAVLNAKGILEAAGQEKLTEEQEIEDKEAYLSEEVGRYKSEMDRLTNEQQALNSEQHVRDRELKAARAKSQKFGLEIEEIKKLMSQQNRPGTRPDFALIERYNFQIREIEEKKSAEDEKIRSAQQRLGEIETKLRLVEGSVKETQGKLSQADQRKSQVLVSLQERSDQVARKFHQLHNEYNKCLRNLALAAFKKGDIPADFMERKASLVQKIKIADEADTMLEKYLLAMESYNRDVYSRGKIMLFAGGGILGLVAAGLAVTVILLLRSLLG